MGRQQQVYIFIFLLVSALGFGVLSIAIAYLAEHLGSRVLQFTLSIFGVVGGPLLGLFICGLLLNYINALVSLSFHSSLTSHIMSTITLIIMKVFL